MTICSVSHHHYARVVLECAGIHNKLRALLLQVGFSITSSEADQPNPASTVTANKLHVCIIVYFEVRSISGKGKH